MSEAKILLKEHTLQEMPDYCDLSTVKEFVKYCKSGSFIDSDGFGNYALKNKVSDKEVKPSDVVSGNIDFDFTHVVWFNK